MSNNLDLKSLNKRMVKTVSSEDALKKISPFQFSKNSHTDDIKILVDKDRNQCAKKET